MEIVRWNKIVREESREREEIGSRSVFWGWEEKEDIE